MTPPEDVDHGLDDNEQQGGGGLFGKTIRILNGNAIERREDLRFPSPNNLGLSFQATYNSRSNVIGSLGHGWIHTYGISLDPSFNLQGKNFIKIRDQSGKAHYFLDKETGSYEGVFKESTYVKAEAGGYVWYRLDGSKYGFSTTGKPAWIEDNRGNRLELGYNGQNQLETVTDAASGRALNFHYYANGLLSNITGPAAQAVPHGKWVSFGYDDNHNLTSLTYGDGSGFTYAYTDPNDIHNLTGKRNKLNHLLGTWRYDINDRAVDTFSVDGKGVSVQYVNESQVDVTDAYGTLRTYTLEKIDGRKRVSAMKGPPNAPYGNSNGVRWVYDDEMNLVEVEYAGGTIAQYQDYDNRGNPGTVIFASGTAEERVIALTYHPDMNLLLARTEPSVLGGGNKATIWDYDDDYDTTPNEDPTKLLSRIIERGYTKDGSAAIVPYEHITTFTYNSKGQVTSVDGPLQGGGDTTSFVYDSGKGDLLTMTRPLIGDTTFSQYDGAGHVGMITDENGQSELFSYDGKGRITTITHMTDVSLMTFTYNRAGQLNSVTDEGGITRTFDYDTNYGRLIRITDRDGNYMAYDYDAQGNRIEMSYHDPSDTRTFWKRWSYTKPGMPGRLWREINPDETYMEYGYAASGNINSITDPKGHTTTYGYDTLNRLKTLTQPGDVTTSYAYDRHGNLISITDAEGQTTTYKYDDMGRVTSAHSPDTGTVTYVYDEWGNAIKETDARGITMEFKYDLLHRLVGAIFPDPSENISYIYDERTNGTGRLTGITDPSGKTAFYYDNRGRLTQKTSTIIGVDFTLNYTYTPGNRLESVAYPTGRTVNYGRNINTGKIVSISTTHNSDTTALMSHITYLPFGPASKMDTGSGSGVNNGFDEFYRKTVANPGAPEERTYKYDANGNMTDIQTTNNPSKDRRFSYDALNRLAQAVGPYGTITYTYDKVGNPLTRTINGQTESFIYLPGTNKLTQVVDANLDVAYNYDANGNTTEIGNKTLIYNQNNRLIQSKENETVLGNYSYNGLGQRVIKEVQGVTTIFVYDLNGNVVAESLPDGTMTSEYIYMENNRLARVDTKANVLYYYLNDHLGTPHLMTDKRGAVVWEADYDPFGDAHVHPSSHVVNNFRLPGQYFDPETGLHYNYFRDYHPGVGRYMEPDPIGLKGGINLYAYAFNNPVNVVDPKGEQGIAGIIIGAASGAFAGYVAGKQAGNVWGGIVGGLIGGFAGGALGFAYAPGGSIVGSVIGGAIAGAFGGATGGAVSKRLLDRDASIQEIAFATLKGASIGAVTGATAGGLSAAAVVKVGAVKFAADLAGAMASAPITMVLGVINSEISEAKEGHFGSTMPENYEYPPDWFPEFEYDPYNPDEIDPNSSITIYVIGGNPPYTWQVSGDGFSLSKTQTWGSSNTLFADVTACGSVAITVTDAAGDTVTGYVRSTAGKWVLKGNYCGLSGSVPWYRRSPSPLSWLAYQLIEGNKRQDQLTTRSYDRGLGMNCTSCTAWCETKTCPEQKPVPNLIFPTALPEIRPLCPIPFVQAVGNVNPICIVWTNLNILSGSVIDSEI
jgi:RHS repeat-associated protein